MKSVGKAIHRAYCTAQHPEREKDARDERRRLEKASKASKIVNAQCTTRRYIS